MIGDVIEQVTRAGFLIVNDYWFVEITTPTGPYTLWVPLTMMPKDCVSSERVKVRAAQDSVGNWQPESVVRVDGE